MKLHIFNPEHDVVLAYNRPNITLPHAVQELRINMGFLPALWADDADCVLVDDVAFAIKAVRQVKREHADVLFLTKNDLKNLYFTKIEPWGWDREVCTTLVEAGINADIIPTQEDLLNIRMLSSRRTAAGLLSYLCDGTVQQTCGKSFYVDNMRDLESLLAEYSHVVVKALWSSNGRGLRYLSVEQGISDSIRGWIESTLHNQGGIMVEPYYNKVKDFALEFYMYGDGIIEYQGISVFDTKNGIYTGNIITTEDKKVSLVCKYIPVEILTQIRQCIVEYLSEKFKNIYNGPFGIDMMIVADANNGQFLLHPCVEMNLRRTMGHVANAIKHDDKEPDLLMSVVHDVNYKLKFEYMENAFVKTI
ncbi:MAG: hypothetical protein LUC91_00930 [Prevotella sp.]|nr:hypothetical protein [Prevotella sp.]